MSVDYYTCQSCDESVYNEYIAHCSECGVMVGSCCYVNKDKDSNYWYDFAVKCDGTQKQADEYGFELDDYKIGEQIDDAGFDSKYCPFCSGDVVSESMLLNHALKMLELTEDQLKHHYKLTK